MKEMKVREMLNGQLDFYENRINTLEKLLKKVFPETDESYISYYTIELKEAKKALEVIDELFASADIKVLDMPVEQAIELLNEKVGE